MLGLRAYRAARHQAGQANAITNIGWCHSLLGEYEPALACYRQALTLHRELDNRDGECCTWDCLGDTYRQLNQHDHAIACYRNGTRLFRELGHRPDLARALANFGDTLRATGRLHDARAAWQEADVILDDLHDPGADRILAKLSGLGAA